MCIVTFQTKTLNGLKIGIILFFYCISNYSRVATEKYQYSYDLFKIFLNK